MKLPTDCWKALSVYRQSISLSHQEVFLSHILSKANEQRQYSDIYRRFIPSFDTL